MVLDFIQKEIFESNYYSSDTEWFNSLPNTDKHFTVGH